ncbi:DUF859 family phage minor structural protein [Anaerococcus obesiensis]|uniref:DUF859 family phage minor structural protein n=1 Tax=Anaerococcus obesiensis TaxID=1287640 RepID=UPI0002F2E3F3|nr:DUF859 family phage minor structural protein [Anaerococcus obesiensis]
MATYSASIRNGTGTIHLEIRQESQSIANNTSTVYYRLYIQGKGGYGFWNKYHTGKTSVVINGSTVHSQSGRDFDIRNGGTQQLASGTTTVKHNEDGSKSFSFSASLWSSSATGSISGNFTLSKIPRASSFSLQNTSGTNISSIYAGNTVKIAINKKVSFFTHTIKLSYSGTGETVANKTTSSSVNWSNSTNVMTNYMQNLKSMNLTFTLETYDGSTRIGTSSKNLTLNVPSSASPTINSVNVTEANQNKINIIGSSPFYQLLSDLNVVTDASANYGASIKNINVSLGSITRTGVNVKLEDINLSGNQNIKVTVQDSRGFSASTTKTINLSPYNLPNISFFNAYREETNTKYASARISLTSTVISNKNPLDVKVDVAEKDTNNWRNVYSATVGNGKFNGTISLGGEFNDYKAYDVRLSIADKFKRHQAISSIPTTSQSLVIGANKPVVGVGRVPTHIDKGLEVDGEICFNGEIKPFGEAGKVIDLKLSDGLTGFIKTIKDPLGGVRIWGKVDITNTNPIKKYYTWATLPKGYNCNLFIGFSLYSYILGGHVNIIPGMGITDDGRIRYIGIINENDKIEVGSTNEFTFYFKTEGAW